mgnify:CR=1 FL=1
MVKVNTSGRGGRDRNPRKGSRTKPRKRPRYEEEEYEDDYESYDDYDDDEYDGEYDEYDDDDYYDDDEYDDDDDRPSGQSVKQKALIIGGVLGVLVLLAIGIRLMNGGSKDAPKPEEPKVEDVKKSEDKSEEKKPETSKEKETSPSVNSAAELEKAATAALETPDVVGTNDESKTIADHIDASIKKIETDGKDFKNNEEGGLSITGYSMMSNLKLALREGYKVDPASVKAYKSHSDGILQFTLTMKNDNGHAVAFAGNYVASNKQMELATMKGRIEYRDQGSASNTEKGSKQVSDNQEERKNTSDKPVNPAGLTENGKPVN